MRALFIMAIVTLIVGQAANAEFGYNIHDNSGEWEGAGNYVFPVNGKNGLGVLVGRNTVNPLNGTIRYSGTDIEGYVNNSWVSLTLNGTGVGGALPSFIDANNSNYLNHYNWTTIMLNSGVIGDDWSGEDYYIKFSYNNASMLVRSDIWMGWANSIMNNNGSIALQPWDGSFMNIYSDGNIRMSIDADDNAQNNYMVIQARGRSIGEDALHYFWEDSSICINCTGMPYTHGMKINYDLNVTGNLTAGGVCLNNDCRVIWQDGIQQWDDLNVTKLLVNETLTVGHVDKYGYDVNFYSTVTDANGGRLFWDESKAALRGGVEQSGGAASWSDDNVGWYSFGWGYTNNCLGDRSFCVQGSSANSYTVSLGYGSNANGLSCVAIGNLARCDTTNSLATGYLVESKGGNTNTIGSYLYNYDSGSTLLGSGYGAPGNNCSSTRDYTLGLCAGNSTPTIEINRTHVAFKSLTNCDSIDTDAFGTLSCGTDEAGGIQNCSVIGSCDSIIYDDYRNNAILNMTFTGNNKVDNWAMTIYNNDTTIDSDNTWTGIDFLHRLKNNYSETYKSIGYIKFGQDGDWEENLTLTQNTNVEIGVNALGASKGMLKTIGLSNVFLGFYSGQSLTTSNTYNIGIGTYSISNSGASNHRNVIIGGLAGNTVNAADNVMIGYQAGYYTDDSSNGNILIGRDAGLGSSAYDNALYNIIIGYQAGMRIGANQDRNIIIGTEAGQSVIGDDKLIISNHNTSTSFIYGDMATGTLDINANMTVNGTLNTDMVNIKTELKVGDAFYFNTSDNTSQIGDDTKVDLATITIGGAGQKIAFVGQYGTGDQATQDINFLDGQVKQSGSSTGSPIWYYYQDNSPSGHIGAHHTFDQMELATSDLTGNQLSYYSRECGFGDFAHPDRDDPTLYVQGCSDPDDDNNHWMSFRHDNTTGIIEAGDGKILFNKTNITIDGLVFLTTQVIGNLSGGGTDKYLPSWQGGNLVKTNIFHNTSTNYTGIGVDQPIARLDLGNDTGTDNGIKLGRTGYIYAQSAEGAIEINSGVIRLYSGPSFFASTSSGFYCTGAQSGGPYLVCGNADENTPAFGFNGDIDTGFGRKNANESYLIAGGNRMLEINQTYVSFTGTPKLFAIDDESAVGANESIFSWNFTSSDTSSSLQGTTRASMRVDSINEYGSEHGFRFTTDSYGVENTNFEVNPRGIKVGTDKVPQNITMFSPNGESWNCGVANDGTFSCS